MAQHALTPAGLELDAFTMTGDGWRELVAATRARVEPLVLSCGQCHIRLRLRDPGARARRHFYHEALAPRSCTNTAGEGESDAHRTVKGTVAAAYSALPGIVAATEQTMLAGDETIRVDVLARRGLLPVSAAEVQLSYQPPDEIRRRNRQRRMALASATPGVATTTPWFSSRAVEAWYLTVPVLWTTQDGQRVTDGIYLPHRSGGGDLDAPIELDIDQVAARLVSGALVELDLGDQAYWLDRSSIIEGAKVKRGRRRYRREPTGPATGDLPPCDREPPEAGPPPVLADPAGSSRVRAPYVAEGIAPRPPVVAARVALGRVRGGGRTASRAGTCEVCGFTMLGPPFRHAHHDDPDAAGCLTPTDHQEDHRVPQPPPT